MPRSSESVAALASALAKAQAELANPEKSQVAMLPPERGQPGRSFRYAPLAGGLDIVRKTLGRHEIATIQTTAIDQDSGTIKLTTTLAHASGEWIASDWPVCPLADLPTPHRMGAALTYARRYGLFTMVGIAGEDDLDAPDLPLQPAVTPLASPAPVSSSMLHRKNGKSAIPNPIVTLGAEDSLRLRDRLLQDLASIASFADAAAWAKRNIPIKNTLAVEHAREVEAAFEARVAQCEATLADGVASPGPVGPQPSIVDPAEAPAPMHNNRLVSGPTRHKGRRNVAHLGRRSPASTTRLAELKTAAMPVATDAPAASFANPEPVVSVRTK